jgi:hypothetical protein
MGVKHVEAFGDSLLVMQQIADTFQCLDGSLNAYLDKCLEIIALFDDFIVQHVSRDENIVVNDLVQQVSGFRSNRWKFGFLEKPDVLVFQIGRSSFQPMCSATVCSVGPSPTKPDSPVSKTGGSRISRIMKEIKRNNGGWSWWLEDTPGTLFREPWSYCW